MDQQTLLEKFCEKIKKKHGNSKKPTRGPNSRSNRYKITNTKHVGVYIYMSILMDVFICFGNGWFQFTSMPFSQ